MVPTGDAFSSETWLIVKFAFTFSPTCRVEGVNRFVVKRFGFEFNEKTKYAPVVVCAVIRFGPLTAVTVPPVLTPKLPPIRISEDGTRAICATAGAKPMLAAPVPAAL
jgi:hypothetical protein